MQSPTSEEAAFARQLSSNDAKVRDAAVNKLQLWLAAQKIPTEISFLKLWKGLFHCFWMSDKVTVQQSLATNISNLTRHCATMKAAFLFVRTYFITINREWFNIDYLRTDKFLTLGRRMTEELLRLAILGEHWKNDKINIPAFRQRLILSQQEEGEEEDEDEEEEEEEEEAPKPTKKASSKTASKKTPAKQESESEEDDEEEEEEDEEEDEEDDEEDEDDEFDQEDANDEEEEEESNNPLDLYIQTVSLMKEDIAGPLYHLFDCFIDSLLVSLPNPFITTLPEADFMALVYPFLRYISEMGSNETTKKVISSVLDPIVMANKEVKQTFLEVYKDPNAKPKGPNPRKQEYERLLSIIEAGQADEDALDDEDEEDEREAAELLADSKGEEAEEDDDDDDDEEEEEEEGEEEEEEEEEELDLDLNEDEMKDIAETMLKKYATQMDDEEDEEDEDQDALEDIRTKAKAEKFAAVIQKKKFAIYLPIIRSVLFELAADPETDDRRRKILYHLFRLFDDAIIGKLHQFSLVNGKIDELLRPKRERAPPGFAMPRKKKMKRSSRY